MLTVDHRWSPSGDGSYQLIVNLFSGIHHAIIQANNIEINILGGAKQADKEIVIVGECKSQLSKKDVDDFIRKKIKRLEGVFKETFLLLITYMITEPDVERHLKEKGIALYYSYDFEP